MSKMIERGFKGIWIPREIWLSKDLSALEKALLVEIDSLDCEQGCFASNSYFADFLQVKERRISQMISKLKSLGFIELASFDGRKRVLRSLLSKNIEEIEKKQDSKILNPASQNIKPCIAKKCEADMQDIASPIIYTNNTVIKTSIIEKNNKKKNVDKINKNELYLSKLPDYVDKELFQKFIEHRKHIKKPMSDHVYSLILGRIKKIHAYGEDVNEKIEYSIIGGYPSLYSEEDNKNFKPKKKKKSISQSIWDADI